MAAGNEPAEAALRANTLRIARDDLAARLPSRRTPPTDCPRASSSTRRSTRSPRRCGSRACSCRSRAPRWRSRARSRRSPATRSSTSAPRPAARPPTWPRSMGNDGRDRRRRAPPGPRRRAAPHGRSAWARRAVEVRTADAAVPQEPAPTTACSSTRRARTSARSRRGPTSAGARTPATVAALAAARRRQILDAGAQALRPGGVLVYSTCTISPAENERQIDAFLDAPRRLRARRPAVRPARSGTIRACHGSCRRSRTGTARTDSSSRGCGGHERRRSHRPRRRLSGLPRAMAAADEPPRPLSLRELPAPVRADVRVPELRRALDDRADVRAPRCTPATTAGARCSSRYDAAPTASRPRSSPPTSRGWATRWPR